MVDERPERALAIYAKGSQIKRLDEFTYKVRSQSGNGTYLLVKTEGEWRCECPDCRFREVLCKHILSVLSSLTLRGSIIASSGAVPRSDEPEPDERECCHSSRIGTENTMLHDGRT